MAKYKIKTNPVVAEIFDDLDSYREFCVDQGWVFDEAHLYNNKVTAWKQYQRYTENKPVRNNWREDSKQD